MSFLSGRVFDVNKTCKGHTGSRKEALTQQFENEAFPETNKQFREANAAGNEITQVSELDSLI